MNRTPSNHPTSQEKGKAARFRVTPVTLALGIYILLLLSRLLDASVLTREVAFLTRLSTKVRLP